MEVERENTAVGKSETRKYFEVRGAMKGREMMVNNNQGVRKLSFGKLLSFLFVFFFKKRSLKEDTLHEWIFCVQNQ